LPRFEKPAGAALAAAGALAILFDGFSLRAVGAAALLAAGAAGITLAQAQRPRLAAALVLLAGLALTPNLAPLVATLAGALLFAGLLVGTARQSIRAVGALVALLALLAVLVFAGQRARTVDVPGVAALLVFSMILVLLASLVALGRRMLPQEADA